MKQKTFYDGDLNVKKLDLDKIIKFVLTSGIGFVLDFISYFMMTQLINISVVYANFTSSIIGATFVFIVSTRKIFIHDDSKIP
ncbi:GtrA family protein, partial [Ruminococcus sp.]|uniref:GtrA family protein n=1 Tax=Ruminococcus sp. TaxID=41978 RepID=UPI003AF8C893